MALCIGDDGPRTYVYYTPTASASPRVYKPSNPPSRSSIASSKSVSRTSSVTPLSTPSSITTPEPALPTPTLSEDAIVEMILKERVENNGQRIQIPGVDEALYDRIKTRTDAISERLRYHYDLTSCTIIIDTLPSDIHESVQEYLVGTLKYSLRRWVVRFFPGAKVKITGAVDRNLVTAVGIIKGKTPDQGFRLSIPGLGFRRFPTSSSRLAIPKAAPIFSMMHVVGSRRVEENLYYALSFLSSESHLWLPISPIWASGRHFWKSTNGTVIHL
jgi:hypothetical protein